MASEELASVLANYARRALSHAGRGVRPLAAPLDTPKAAPSNAVVAQSASSDGDGGEVVRIPSPAAHGSPATSLLGRLCRNPAAGPPSCCILYLHGFPDQSVDHRSEDSSYGSFTARLPRKLAEAALKERPDAAFLAFNFAGSPGSDQACPFYAKTVSREVADACAVIRFLRDGLLPSPAPVHVVGISTGAIIASLLRGCDPHMTVTAIAGLVDVAKGLEYDFDESQLQAFQHEGACLKEFWLPRGSASNPPAEACEGDPAALGAWQKHYLRLGVQYRDDFLSLDVRSVVQGACSPMLVIHGEADKNVPVSCGQDLFGAAAEPKKLVQIKGANHLLSSTNHLKTATRAIMDLMKNGV